MEDLNTLVGKYFPNEHVVNATKALFKTSLKTPIGNKVNYLYDSGEYPIEMLETNSKYFFDVRSLGTSLKHHKKRLKNPLFVGYNTIFLIVFFTFIAYWFVSVPWNPVFFAIMLLLFIGFIVLAVKLVRSSFGILAIEKSWVTNVETTEDLTTVTWSLPKDANGFSFVNLIDSENYKKLPLIAKIQGGTATMNNPLRALSPVKFEDVKFMFKTPETSIPQQFE